VPTRDDRPRAGGPDDAPSEESQAPVSPAQDPAEHDPTGLELARRLASGIGGTSSTARRKRPRKQSSSTGGDLEPLGAALDDVITSEGWVKDIAVQAVFGRWAAIVGPEIAQHSHPEKLAGKVLIVRADSTAWATSLRTIAAQLVARLNDELGQGEVERVRILGPDAPSWQHGRRTVRGGRGPRDTYG
jgi:predicted nucleic acid-binding Zn ribbon protein